MNLYCNDLLNLVLKQVTKFDDVLLTQTMVLPISFNVVYFYS